MLQNGTVLLFQDVCADLNYIIGSHTDYEAVKGSMVQFTERNAIINRWPAFWQIIWNNVSGIKQLPMSQTAKSAL